MSTGGQSGAAHTTLPTGYARFEWKDATVVARTDAAPGIGAALQVCRTLHGWASTLPGARAYEGRATAWGARLPNTSIDVVVRHAQHGGLLAALTGDRFVNPGRAPWELEVSRRLRDAGVPTPEVVAYLLYPAGPGFCRCDVATRRLPDGADFPTLWRTAAVDTGQQGAILVAVGALLRALANIGAHHPDLNARNIYLAREGGGYRAFVLDVDRIQFLPSGDPRVSARNLARLARSLRKLRERKEIVFPEPQLAALARHAGAS